MKKIKKLAVIAISLTLFVILLIGCASSRNSAIDPTTSDGTSSDANNIKANITFWSMPWADFHENMLLNEVFVEAKKEFPNINIELTMMSWDSGPEKQAIAIATGATPTLLLDTSGRIISHGGSGLCVPVDDVLEDLLADGTVSQIYIDDVSKFTYEDKPYMIPAGGGIPYVFAINQTLAKELGTYEMLPKDKKSWTLQEWADFVKASTNAGRSKGIYGACLWSGSRSSDYFYYTMMLTNGSNILNKDCTAFDLDYAKATQALDLLKNLIDTSAVMPGAVTMTDQDTMNMFFNSKSLMLFVTGTYANTSVKTMQNEGTITKDFVVEVFNLPYGKEQKQARVADWGAAAENFCIFKTASENEAAAAKAFVKWYLGRTDFAARLHREYQMPVNPAVKVDFEDEWLNEQFNRCREYISTADADFGGRTAFWTDVRETFYPQLQAFYLGKITSTQLLDNWTSNAKPIIDAYYAK